MIRRYFRFIYRLLLGFYCFVIKSDWTNTIVRFTGIAFLYWAIHTTLIRASWRHLPHSLHSSALRGFRNFDGFWIVCFCWLLKSLGRWFPAWNRGASKLWSELPACICARLFFNSSFNFNLFVWNRILGTIGHWKLQCIQFIQGQPIKLVLHVYQIILHAYLCHRVIIWHAASADWRNGDVIKLLLST